VTQRARGFASLSSSFQKAMPAIAGADRPRGIIGRTFARPTIMRFGFCPLYNYAGRCQAMLCVCAVARLSQQASGTSQSSRPEAVTERKTKDTYPSQEGATDEFDGRNVLRDIFCIDQILGAQKTEPTPMTNAVHHSSTRHRNCGMRLVIMKSPLPREANQG